MLSRLEIVEFCRKYSSAAHANSGSISISPMSLADIGFNPSHATYDQLRGACVGLSYTLLFKGMNEFISNDHRLLWDSVGKRLLEGSLYFGKQEGVPFPRHLYTFQSLFITVIKTMTREWALYQCKPISAWSWPAQDVGRPAAYAADPGAYLVYPLLEGTLKYLQPEHLKLDGEVVQTFRCSRGREYKKGHICSRVEDMLDLVMQTTSLKDLAEDLQLVFNHIEFLYPGKSATSVISHDWRNPAMHGESNVSTAAGVVLNIALLVAMEKVKERLS
jgi:hypothetical protein